MPPMGQGMGQGVGPATGVAEREDGELLLAWRAGDSRAGNVLFMRHFPALWRFFHGKVGEDAEDLIQRTMLACVSGRDRVRDDGFRPYLFRIARNQLCNHYRRRSTRERHFEPVERSLHDLGPLISTVMVKHEEHKRLLAALRRLPLDVQLTLELYYWEGLRYTELAEVLGVSVDAIKKRLQRGRDQLRAIVRELGEARVVASTLTRLEDWARSLRESMELPDELA